LKLQNLVAGYGNSSGSKGKVTVDGGCVKLTAHIQLSKALYSQHKQLSLISFSIQPLNFYNFLHPLMASQHAWTLDRPDYQLQQRLDRAERFTQVN